MENMEEAERGGVQTRIKGDDLPKQKALRLKKGDTKGMERDGASSGDVKLKDYRGRSSHLQLASILTTPLIFEELPAL